EVNKKIEEANQDYSKDRNSESEGLSSLVWEYMLDLIYSGNEKTAWEFFNQAWPKDVPGKEKFKAEFQQVLEASPNYEEIKKFNSGDNQTGKSNNIKEELQIISFKNGPNKIDLNSDGIQDIVFKSFHNNAILPRDSDVYSFYIFKPKSEYNNYDLWTITQIVDNSDDLGGKNDIEAMLDIDCRISDIRIVKTSDKKTYLILAERDRKLFYYSDEPVNFKIYKLKENTESNPNYPDYYFEKINTVKAKGEYCDVNAAMNAELDPGNKDLTDVLN
ncbi:MAG: hypothetical protein NTU76_01375, partial [Candidatus Taylorbacteria bacterium]|nr:hypothetical protein [Candidatus Taylorbacteria bacterium]